MKPGDLLAAAFALASSRQRKIHEAWIRISYRAGGPLVNSRLGDSVQRMGEIDTVLRCMEEDFRQDEAPSDLSIRRFGLQTAMSDWWIGGLYEIARTLKQRGLMPTSDFANLAEDLRLIRVPLEKYEVPNESKLSVPLAFMAIPAKEGDKPYHYDKTDPARHHNIAKAVSARGSIMWNALSLVPVVSERWIERRALSDRFLDFWPEG